MSALILNGHTPFSDGKSNLAGTSNGSFFHFHNVFFSSFSKKTKKKNNKNTTDKITHKKQRDFVENDYRYFLTNCYRNLKYSPQHVQCRFAVVLEFLPNT